MKRTFLAISLLGGLIVSYAQETELQEVVLQGKFMNLPYNKINENIIIIGKKEIENTPYQSIDEILQQYSGLDIRKRGANGVQSDISIRGGSFEQVLVLINGIRMNDSQTGHNTMTLPIDLDNIEQIEVIKGAAARRFGQNAYAGVINIVTKSHQGKNVKITAEGGDFSTYQLGLSANLGGEKFSQSISVNSAHSDGYRHNTDYHINNVFYHNQLNINNGKINFQAGFVEKKFGANGFYASPLATEQYEETQASVVSASYQQKLTDNFGLDANIYWRRGQDMYLYNRQRPEIYRNMHIGNNLGGEISGNYQSFLGKTSLGVELRKEFLVSSNLGKQDRFITQSFLKHQFAIFNDKLHISPGISWANYNTNGNFFYPSVSAGFNFNNAHKIFGNISKVHRVPSFTDLYYNSRTEVGNANLSPESAISSEVGYRFQIPKLTAKISGFLRDSNNAIDWVKVQNADKWEAQNIGKMKTQGFEIEFNHRFKDWLNYSASYTYIDNQRDIDNLLSKYALNNLKHQFVAKMENKFLKYFSNQLIYRYNERLNADSYHLLDEKLSFSKDNYNIYLIINNLTNTKYSETGVDIPVPMAGRWFHLGMSYNIKFK